MEEKHYLGAHIKEKSCYNLNYYYLVQPIEGCSVVFISEKDDDYLASICIGNIVDGEFIPKFYSYSTKCGIDSFTIAAEFCIEPKYDYLFT